MTAQAFPDKLSALMSALEQTGYVCDEQLASALTLMETLGRPLLLEGDAGVGKTAVAAALAKVRNTRLIRLQCYEGLDVHSALYEWNVQRQFLEIRRHQGDAKNTLAEDDLFAEKFLLKRPLLEALTQDTPPVLLIDEVDRADEEFEAFLLEMLSEYQISIPELGVVHAKTKPLVILTANGTRDLSDALRRRCLYMLLDYPSPEKESHILRQTLPELDGHLAGEIVTAVNRVRAMDLRKAPGIAETLDWAGALMTMGIKELNARTPRLQDTLSCLLKTREDVEHVKQQDIETWVK